MFIINLSPLDSAPISFHLSYLLASAANHPLPLFFSLSQSPLPFSVYAEAEVASHHIIVNSKISIWKKNTKLLLTKILLCTLIQLTMTRAHIKMVFNQIFTNLEEINVNKPNAQLLPLPLLWSPPLSLPRP